MNVAGLPVPERGFLYLAKTRDLQRGIPERAFLFLELRGDGPQRPLALGDPPVIARAGQPEIQLQRIGGLGRLAECQEAEQDAEPGPDAGSFQEAWSFQGCEQVAHGRSAG